MYGDMYLTVRQINKYQKRACGVSSKREHSRRFKIQDSKKHMLSRGRERKSNFGAGSAIVLPDTPYRVLYLVSQVRYGREMGALRLSTALQSKLQRSLSRAVIVILIAVADQGSSFPSNARDGKAKTDRQPDRQPGQARM